MRPRLFQTCFSRSLPAKSWTELRYVLGVVSVVDGVPVVVDADDAETDSVWKCGLLCGTQNGFFTPRVWFALLYGIWDVKTCEEMSAWSSYVAKDGRFTSSKSFNEIFWTRNIMIDINLSKNEYILATWRSGQRVSLHTRDEGLYSNEQKRRLVHFCHMW